jgi:deoxyribose-phosphate aldolase
MDINRYIEHTNLKSFATEKEIEALCEEALLYRLHNVCIMPSWVDYAVRNFGSRGLTVCTVVGFPLGAHTTVTKLYEVEQAIKSGAAEIDAVINIAMVLEKKWNALRQELSAIRQQVKINPQHELKIIFETCYLTDEDIIRLCEICVELEIDFVKTSTGYGNAGATTAHVSLMKSICGEKSRVKASGGIRDLATCLEMIHAGADRIGTSNGVPIIQEYNKLIGNYEN